MRGVRLKNPPGGSATSLIQLADLTCLGAFATPIELDFGNGLMYRYVSSQLRLYSLRKESEGGHLIEFVPVADGSLSLTGSGFAQAAVLNNFGDIFQNAVFRDVADGFTNPPQQGVANAGVPQNIWWDPIASIGYFFKTTGYNNTVTTSDTCLGQFTLNDTTHTGTGLAMWKLSPRKPTGYGNRWVTGGLPIPSAFATAYCSGRRIGVGFGGAFSVISNGPPSSGPALFAINPPVVGVDPDRDYILGGLTQLLNYPADVTRAPRPAAYQAQQSFDSYGATDWNWNDGFGSSIQGVWIEGVSKHGVLFFTLLSGGNVNTTILASPTPTHNVFSVVTIGDLQVGDYVKWDTDSTAAQSPYHFCVGFVSGVSGSQITIDPATIRNGDPNVAGGADPGGVPLVGGNCFAGGWYQGGGDSATRWFSSIYAYDPADLALIAQGASPYSKAPYLSTLLPMPGQPTTYIGGDPNVVHPGQIAGACFDPITNRLYVMTKFLPNRHASSYNLVYVYTVNC